MNTESCKRKYTPRANQWTLEDDMKLRQLHGEGKGWTELSAEFGRDPDAIRKHFKYAEEKERLPPVLAAEPQSNIAIACVDLVRALRANGESIDASWGLDFSVMTKIEKHYARDNAVHSCQLRETGRQKQAIRVNIINQSNLGTY